MKIFTLLALLIFSVGMANASEDPFHRPPVNKNVNLGELLSITCKPGPNAVSIQWFKDGMPINNESGMVYKKPFTALPDAGTYYAEVTYNTQCGMLRTNDVIVKINQDAKLGTPSANTVSLGSPEPNPVNDQSIIKFFMPESSHARLILLDMSGSQAAVLFDGIANQGLNTVLINATELNLSSGTYFLKLATDIGYDSQTLNILK